MSVPWLVQVDVIAAFSFLGLLLVSVPLYWHFAAWNVGCVLYIFWVGGQCFVQFVDLMIWRDSTINVAPVWCDITIRFYIASSLGVCCSSLVINRRLYHIARVTRVSSSRAEKRRNILTDLGIGLGIPILGICLFWFYQGHRYDIYEGVGCIEEYPNTFLAFLLYHTWPIPVGLVSAAYCVLTLRAFLRQRREFGELMQRSSVLDLTFGRYFRLMGLAAINMLFTVPLAAYTIVLDLRVVRIYQWRGLGDLHWGFGRVNEFPAVQWRESTAAVNVVNFRLWSPVACALAFFVFFGLAEEARSHYRTALSSVANMLGLRLALKDTSGSSAASVGPSRFMLPSFVRHVTTSGSTGSVSEDKLPGGVSVDDSGLGVEKGSSSLPISAPEPNVPLHMTDIDLPSPPSPARMNRSQPLYS